jgi:CRISPR-associated endoribonuclease Cas6
MKIHLKISSNKYVLPFDHLPYLVGTFHKWLGENEIHGDLALHSLSWLKGGERKENGLHFPNGATWFITAYSDEVIKKLIGGIRQSPEVCFGMVVREVIVQETPVFESPKLFTVNSPVLVKTHRDGRQKHLSFDDPQAEEVLTNVLKNKLAKAGMNTDGVKVYFKTDSDFPKQKLVNYRGVGNKANYCPVIVEGTPEQIGFAWNVGIGHSTGIGFGALN